MKLKVSAAEAVAMNKLRNNADFNLFLKMLKSNLAEQDAANRIEDGNSLYRGQGIAQSLHSIIDTVDNSAELIAKFRTQKG